MEPTYNQIIGVLKNWVWDSGEIEEIVQKLAEDDERYLVSAEAEVYDNHIAYDLELTREGRELYRDWCAKHGYYAKLEYRSIPTIENGLRFDDENESSIECTLQEWSVQV